jgi:hypothetical protein
VGLWSAGQLELPLYSMGSTQVKIVKRKRKVVPLQAVEAHGGSGGVSPLTINFRTRWQTFCFVHLIHVKGCESIMHNAERGLCVCVCEFCYF